MRGITKIYIYIYIYTHLFIHVVTYIYIYICIHTHTYTHAYTHIYIYIYVTCRVGLRLRRPLDVGIVREIHVTLNAVRGIPKHPSGRNLPLETTPNLPTIIIPTKIA